MKIPLRQYWTLLAVYLRPLWPRVLLLALLVLGSIGLQLANPQVMRVFIDTAQAGGEQSVLVGLALLFLGIALTQQIISVVAIYVSETVAWLSTNALRADLVDHCLRLDLSFHNAHTPGEMIERIDGDVTAMTSFFSQFVIQVLGNSLLMVGILVLLFREDVRVGLVLGGFAILTLFVLARFRNVAVPHWKAQRQASAELFGFLEERLAGTEDIRANGGETYTMRRFYGLMRELLHKSLKAGLMSNVLINSSILLFALGNAAAFAVGAWLYQAGELTIGSVYIIFHYTNMLQQPINQITRQLQELQRAGAGMIRIQELLQVQSGLPAAAGDRHLPAGPLAVEFCDVSFGYADGTSVGHEPGSAGAQASLPVEAEQAGLPIPQQPATKDMVLCHVSFDIPPGTVLGLLGRTGSGKTTLTRLLFRFYDPDHGSVSLSGEAAPGCGSGQAVLRAVPLDELRRRVGMVTQNVQLFNASVRDNLTFFDPSVPDERIWQVVHDLELDEWFGALPNGLDTVLESGGSGLSAGEAQLLAFMRIFLENPGLVILDEASSRLDPATEHLLERAVDRLVRGRTAIIVAHRLATVQRAGRILILEDGEVVEYGERVALASDPGSRFYRLLQTGLEEVLV